MMNKGTLYKIFIIPLLLCFLVCPFHIYADTLITTSNITGCHITNVSFSDSTAYNNISCDMDSYYYGYANMTIQYYVGSSNTPTSQAYFITVSGNTFEAVIPTSNTSINRQKAISVIQVNDNHIYLKDDLNYQDIMWMFPIDSFNIVSYNMQEHESQLSGITDYSLYKFPMFDLSANDNIYISWLVQNLEYYLIFFTDKNFSQLSEFSTFLNIPNVECTTFENIVTARFNGTYGHILKLTLKATSTGTSIFKVNQNMKFMPIFFNQTNNRYITTDFALNFGLSNSYLDNIAKIAEGTNSSSTASDNLETVSDDISSSSDDLIQSENSFNNSMNSNLQQIDTNINIGNLGSKFLASADWVRMQFNTLTNGTPFGSVLSFSLLLGLALILVGKVRK